MPDSYCAQAEPSVEDEARALEAASEPVAAVRSKLVVSVAFERLQRVVAERGVAPDVAALFDCAMRDIASGNIDVLMPLWVAPRIASKLVVPAAEAQETESCCVANVVELVEQVVAPEVCVALAMTAVDVEDVVLEDSASAMHALEELSVAPAVARAIEAAFAALCVAERAIVVAAERPVQRPVLAPRAARIMRAQQFATLLQERHLLMLASDRQETASVSAPVHGFETASVRAATAFVSPAAMERLRELREKHAALAQR